MNAGKIDLGKKSRDLPSVVGDFTNKVIRHLCDVRLLPISGITVTWRKVGQIHPGYLQTGRQ